jgi:hypothetical protein
MKEGKKDVFPIDFVVTWVDGSDREWQRSKAQYTGASAPETAASDQPMLIDDSEERYRDWDLLPYWFRGIETCAPWVRNVYFVTQGHLPPWLNRDHPKLKIVSHDAYIPSEYLPTFNSHTIELNMHKLPGISDHFVYFNDDMFLLKEVAPTLFFRKGVPRDMLAFQPVVANPRNPVMSHIYLNNTLVLSKYFNKREGIRKYSGHYFNLAYPSLYFFYNLLEMAFPLFTGFYTVHGPSPFMKKTFETLWEKEGEMLHRTCLHRLRSSEDVSPYLLREWQKLSGAFVPGNTAGDTAYYNLTDDNHKLCKTIEGGSKPMVCINDDPALSDFRAVKHALHQAFTKHFPLPSAYEKGTT